MPKFKVTSWGLKSSAAAIALVGLTATAMAYETKFGEVSIVFDTTVSMGGSMRTSDRETAFLPEGNGGPVDIRNDVVINTPVLALGRVPGPGFGQATYTAESDNFDGSVNTDDGRLNFDSGDLIGATLKANHDLQVTWQNYKFFARAVGFYDVVMNDKDVGDRSLLTDQALGDVGRNYELLDAFVSADYVIGDLPVNLRLGKQVINWGESTFILGGNNVFNPIDVGAFRRPGSEIKEALLPVNAVSGSITLPFDVSLSGYYALDWEPFELDPSGTPFSTADVVALGSGFGGNVDRTSFLSGNPLTGQRRNCVAAPGSAVRIAQTLGLINDPTVSTAGKLDCNDDNALTGILANTINYQSFYTIGQHESVKLGLVNALSGEGYTALSGAGQVVFDRSIHPNDDGQFGISARYFADWLDGTEFGFYYQNYHSRLPFISEQIEGAGELGFSVTGDSAQATPGSIGGRQLLPAGCGYNGATDGGGVFAVAQATANAQASGTIAAVNAAGFGGQLANTPVIDSQNLLDPSINAALVAAGLPALQLTANGAGSYDHVLNAMRLNCALAFYQTTASLLAAPPAGLGVLQLVNGAETLTLTPNLGLLVEYPEDIEAWGASFNTTILGWGVQGDFTYRHNAPFQVDTDSLTIAGAWLNCAFQVGTPGASTFIGGPTGALTFLRQPDGSGVLPQCVPGTAGAGQKLNGVIRNEMYTAQVGTTATFTASEWWIEMLDADLGLLVTEIGMAYVPDVENSYINAGGALLPQYQGTGCQGSDLGLGGILGLDPKRSKQCRPTDFSAGLVLLFRLDYNNAFDTGFLISPQIAYSWDFDGTTPSPYGNYLEDRQSVNLGVTGTLNNNFRIGASYTNFFGGHIQNKAKDQDFASITASYSF